MALVLYSRTYCPLQVSGNSVGLRDAGPAAFPQQFVLQGAEEIEIESMEHALSVLMTGVLARISIRTRYVADRPCCFLLTDSSCRRCIAYPSRSLSV
jgi:hypothetical protein